MIEIIVNTQNHKEYNLPYKYTWEVAFKKCFKAHESLVQHLEDRFGSGSTIDWGSNYANFLQRFGINHQTEHGWWSKCAVDKENIEFFIKYMISDVDSEFMKQVGLLEDVIGQLKHTHNVQSKFNTLNEMLDAFIKPEHTRSK